MTTTTVDTKRAKVMLPSTVDGQEMSTYAKTSAKELQSIFLPHQTIIVDDVLEEEPHTPKVPWYQVPCHTKTGLTLTADVVKENKLLRKDVRDMVCNAYSRVQLAESNVEGGTRKYRRVALVKKSLSLGRLSKMMKCIQMSIVRHLQDSIIWSNFERQST